MPSHSGTAVNATAEYPLGSVLVADMKNRPPLLVFMINLYDVPAWFVQPTAPVLASTVHLA